MGNKELESYERGKRYNKERRSQGGTGSNQYQSKGKKENTADRLGEELNCSSRTLSRDGEYAEAIDILINLVGKNNVNHYILEAAKPIVKKEKTIELADYAQKDPDGAKQEFFSRTNNSKNLLIKSGGRWIFYNETELESFIYNNLSNLLEMRPLERQLSINRERSDIPDIIALDNNQQIVLLELKNDPYPYIVNQLTRYYARFCKKNFFHSGVNISKPLRLIAIAPRYHTNSLIDKKYSKLDFEFWEYEVTKENNNFYLMLKNIDTGELSKQKLLIKGHIHLDS